MMGEFNAKDANFLWRQIGRIDGVIETLNRTDFYVNVSFFIFIERSAGL